MPHVIEHPPMTRLVFTLLLLVATSANAAEPPPADAPPPATAPVVATTPAETAPATWPPPDGSDYAPYEDVAGREGKPPRYPARARCATGLVTLLVEVDATGAVVEVTVEKSSGTRLLDKAGAEAAGKWTYRPGRVAGQPVGGRVRVPIAFRGCG